METETEYWNWRYDPKQSNSGGGSYGKELELKLKWLAPLQGIRSIAEVGCGDFNFGMRVMGLYGGPIYIGTDISDVIIEKNKNSFPFASFELGDHVPKADLLLCVD